MKDATSRRRVLSAIGAAALAGCGGLMDQEEAPAIDGTALQNPGTVPSIDRPLPVSLDDEHFAAGRDRAESLLSTVPSQFGPGEIPNEAVRNELADVRGRARDELAGAADASSSIDRLGKLRYGRGSAANVDAAWESIDGDLDRAAVRERVDPIRTALSDFRDRWAYVGDSTIRAVVVHETIETLVDQADTGTSDDVESNEIRPENAVTIGLLAGELERARAALDDATGVYEALEESVSGDVSATIDSAADSLVSTLEERRDGLPDGDPDEPSSFVEPDVEGTPASRALERLYRESDNVEYVRDAVEAGRLATAVLRAHGRLARFEAFDSLRERVNDGETFEVTSAEDVTRRRSGAVSAIEGAVDESPSPLLARTELASSVASVRHIDDRLRQVSDEPSPSSLEWEVADYLVVEETASGVPIADAAVVEALDAPEDNP